MPNARYADLNQDLSASVKSYTGRHPLPNFNSLSQKIGAWGIQNHTQVVVYDDVSGAFAGRLWWLLRTMGHKNVAVLNGGIKQWLRCGYHITTTLPRIKTTSFRPYLDPSAWVSATQLQDQRAQRHICLLDARTPERYRGTQEPIDPIAGHIPGALNRPMPLNLTTSGLFLPANTLREQFLALLDDKLPEQTVHYCGSGVTACHNLLAMEHAGLTDSKLYAGSWSEWIRDKNHPVACDYT